MAEYPSGGPGAPAGDGRYNQPELSDRPTRKARLLGLIAVFALLAAACAGGGGGSASRALPEYRVGIFEDTTTDNFWAFLDSELSIWNNYLLSETKPSFFDLVPPINEDTEAGGRLVPDLAAGLPVEPVRSGDVWVVEQPIRQGLRWSDGEEITAEDFVFTVNTVHQLDLGGNWLSFYPQVDDDNPEATGIVRAEAVGRHVVRITFNHRPGLALWPHNLGYSASWMPEHFWAGIVEKARGGEDPAAALYAASGVGDPSGGAVVFSSREPGAFARVVANEHYHLRGAVTTLFESGAVRVTLPGGVVEWFGGTEGGPVAMEYRTGPFLESEILRLYSSQEAAVLALRQGEVDVLLNPAGMQQGLASQVFDAPDLEAVVNPTYGFTYLGFNLRKFPMSEKPFRQALSVMIDREFMAERVLQGAASPAYATMPPGNARWFDEHAAAGIAERLGAGLDEGERLAEAVRILEDGGFRWATRPRYDAGRGAVDPGTGLVGPQGQQVPPLELLTSGPGDDPLRATYAVWVQRWARDLGIPLSTNPTSASVIRPRLFTQPGLQPRFDLALFMWSNLGNAAFPSFYEILWHSRHDPFVSGGSNAPGFENPEFDRLADAYLAAGSEEEAFALVWQMERILADELPSVPLYNTPILEFYRSESVRYPFTETLGGLQDLVGLPAWVLPA